MNKAIKLEDVLGRKFLEDLKEELPKASEIMQFHMVEFVVDKVATFIYQNSLETQDPIRDSRDIVLRELGDCCQMFRTVCEGEPSVFHICKDKVYRVSQ